ncbi:hypothetical protein AX16_009951 [Volvariella volvacea WC 439]|nr:hypothetical protein AX16_009951 [Volvariella volvacea WC 439]
MPRAVITELELVTLAFATLNFITYFLWWSKPLNAEYPVYFRKNGDRISGPMKIEKEGLGMSDRYSGWNFQFSTDIERDLWRISSIVVTVEPATIAVGFILRWLGDQYPRFEGFFDIFLQPTYLLAAYVGPIFYIPARIALLVLPLFALRDLPPSAHQSVKWSDYIPHI